MTKMADVMREAGFNSKFLDLFFDAGLINVKITDETGEEHQEAELKFVRPLFADNPISFDKFFNFISDLNENPDYIEIEMQITAECVVVFPQTPHAKVFFRTPSPDPISEVDD